MCGHCDIKVNTDDELNEHINSKHSRQNVSHIPCRFFRQGRCDRPTTCRFKHTSTAGSETTKSASLKEAPHCTRGPECSFKKQNRCHYYHAGIGVQMPKEFFAQKSSHQTQEKNTPKLWCKYQDTCSKGPQKCPFRHY